MRKIAAFMLAVIMTVSPFVLSACNNQKTEGKSPVITTAYEVPVSGTVGREVVLPVANATDGSGNDITERVKVTVEQYRADGTLNRELLYQVAANVERRFTPASNNLLRHKIIYFVSDDAGRKTEKVADFMASADETAPVINIDTASVTPALNLETGLSGAAGTDILLPSAAGKDNPGELDMTDKITIKIFVNNGGAKGAQAGDTVTGTVGVVYAPRLSEGGYIIEYSLTDGAGNEASPVTFPLNISAADFSVNLMADPRNFTADPRFVTYNEFNELEIGQTGALSHADVQPFGASMNITKICDQIVGVSFNADPAPLQGGVSFYEFAALGGNDRQNPAPNYETCVWNKYMVLRLDTAGIIEPRGYADGGGTNMAIEKMYNGTNIIDGKDHTIYIQWGKSGTAGESDARLTLKAWIDVLPSESPSLSYYVTRGVSHSYGTLQHSIFDALWNELSGAGWFSVSAATNAKSMDGKFADDQMRIYGVAVYPSSAGEYGVDISRPVITLSGEIDPITAKGESISLPDYTADDNGADAARHVTVKIKKPGAKKYDIITGEQTYTPAEAGEYRLVYEVKNSAGNTGYKAINFASAARIDRPPVITVAGNIIEAGVGSAFTIPHATANSSGDGDITSKLKISYTGAEYAAGLVNGGTYTPKTVGIHRLVYEVTDSFGNKTVKYINVNVTGGVTGNVLGATQLVIGPGTSDGYTSQYVYDKKISMIVNVASQGLIQFNLRGAVGSNRDWPEGLILRFVGTDVQLSSYQHDKIIYGRAPNPFAVEWRLGVDVLLEFQVVNVTVGGIEYIKTRVWLQSEELTWEASGNGGLVKVEQGTRAIYRKVSDFGGRDSANIYAGPLWVSSYADEKGSITISELRIDGTSCKRPSGPVSPSGYPVPSFHADAPDTAVTPVSAAPEQAVKLADYSDEYKIQLKMSASGEERGVYLLQLTDADNSGGWSRGVSFRFSDEGLALQLGGYDAIVADGTMNPNPLLTGTDVVYFTYKLTYVINDGLVTALKVEAWWGSTEENQIKIKWTARGDSADCISGTEIVLPPARLNDSYLAPAPLMISSPTGGGTITVLEIKIVE